MAEEVPVEEVPAASAVPAPVPGKGAEVAEVAVPLKGDQVPGAAAVGVEVPGAPPPVESPGEE